MNSFHIRIELHNGVLSDYNTLHLQMEKGGFHRTIIADTGRQYYLPPAEYVISGNFELDSVINAANKAANITGRTSSIFAVKYIAWQSTGLTLVK